MSYTYRFAPILELESRLKERLGFPYCLLTGTASMAAWALMRLLASRGYAGSFDDHAWPGMITCAAMAGLPIQYHASEQVLRIITPAEPVFHASKFPADLTLLDASRLFPHLSALNTGADFMLLSFGKGKPISAGEGGALLLHDYDIYAELTRLHGHTFQQERWTDTAQDAFMNISMSPVLAEIILKQCS